MKIKDYLITTQESDDSRKIEKHDRLVKLVFELEARIKELEPVEKVIEFG